MGRYAGRGKVVKKEDKPPPKERKKPIVNPLVSFKSRREREQLRRNAQGNKCNLTLLKEQRNNIIIYKGISYENIYHLAWNYNVPISVALARLELGWDIGAIVRRKHFLTKSS